MQLKLKKYIYFLNDLTNILLDKERQQAMEDNHKLRKAVIIIAVILGVSLLVNIYLFVKYLL